VRPLPHFRRLKIEYAEGGFAAQALIQFQANHVPHTPLARHVTVEAGRRGTWLVEFTPRETLPPGSRVGFHVREPTFRMAWRFQDYWPDAMNYCTVEDEQGSALAFECFTEIKSRVPAIVNLERGLGAGEVMRLRIGDQRFGGAGACADLKTHRRAHVVASVCLPGGQHFLRASEGKMSVEVVPHQTTARYYLFAPSDADVDRTFRVCASAADCFGNPRASSSEITIEPPARCLGPVDDGSTTLGFEASFADPGIRRLLLRDERNGIRAHSNPVRVGRHDGPKTYWGEFHWHGWDGVELSVRNHMTEPDRLFRFARDVSRLDFTAMGSHIFQYAPHAVGEWWDVYRGVVHDLDRPGSFVPFMGCEWRGSKGGGGDRNIIWREPDALIPDPKWRIDELYDRLKARGQPATMTPHVGGGVAMPDHHDPDLERCIEICSGHGNFEWYAQAWLKKGFKVGFVGGSDGHSGTPGWPRKVGNGGGRFMYGLRYRDSGYSGGPLCAVQADGLTRNELWEAIRARRVYASTGARALVDFSADGRPMGSELETDGPVGLSFSVHGTARIARVDLIRGEHRLAHWTPGAAHFATALEDRPPMGTNYYYLRILQDDDELLWTSPTWVTSRRGGPVEDLPAWNAFDRVDLDAIGDNPASAHLDDLLCYLRTEENIDAFRKITPIRTVRSHLADYAVFYGYLNEHPIRINWYTGFEMPRLRIEAGWCNFGSEPIQRQPWARTF
jgi:hypothetical protein